MPGSGQAPTWAPCSRAWPPHPPWHRSLPTPPSEATELVAAFLFCLLHQLTWLVHCALNLPSDSRHFSLCGFFSLSTTAVFRFLPIICISACAGLEALWRGVTAHLCFCGRTCPRGTARARSMQAGFPVVASSA